jgi:tetratricopeptide (TPR) repeat protein
MTYFEQAISTDPDFALPHAGLADCYTITGIYSIRPTHEVHPKALRLAERALELDPDLPEGNVSLAAVKHFLEWNWTAANKYFTRAIELNPRLAIARSWRATLLVITGRKSPDPLTESVDAMKLEPDSGLIAYIAGINHYWGGDVDTAAALIDRAIELEPMAVFAHWVRAIVFSVKGLHEEAISTTLRATSAANHHPLLVSALGAAYARSGRVGEANDLIMELENRSAREYIAPHYIAEIHLALGHIDQACDWFEKAVDEHNPLLIGLSTAPHYAPLRREARFQAMLRSMNLFDNATDE